MNKNWGDVVPLFMTYAELQRHEHEVLNRVALEWEAAFQGYEAIQAVRKGDTEALAKLRDDQLSVAKAHVERHGALSGYYALETLVKTIRGLADLWNGHVNGATEIHKRSLRFASARQRRYSGPSAGVTDIGEARNGRR